MDIFIDQSLSDCINKGLWNELQEKIPTFDNIYTLCYISHIALSLQKYDFLLSAVSREGFPFYQKINYGGLFVPILLRAVHLRDLRACDILLSKGALALCCAQNCSANCFDILDILFEPIVDSDLSISDVSCLLISSWTKFLQKLFAASKSNNAGVVSSLLEEFKTKCCTFRRYTDLCIYSDPMVYEDLREFTLLYMDPHLDPLRQNRIPSDVTPSSTKSFFNMVAEGAGKAFSAFFSVGEQIVGGGLGERSCMETDLLARRIRNSMTQLTQQYLNAMLISAIERTDFPIINILLDFGFRLQSVPRPSICFPDAVDISTVVKRDNSMETRRNPLEWHLETPGGPDWLLTALRTPEDTPILAAIRRNLFQEDVFNRLLKKGMHLLLLPGAGGILPIHLMAALGRIEMLSAVLDSNDSSLDLVDDCGLTALLISAFYGHIDCVCAILEYLCDEMTEIATSQASDGPDEEDEGEKEQISKHQQKNDHFLSNSFSTCLADVLKSAPMKWYFRVDGSNTLVIGSMRQALGKYFIGASFNCLHLAILTGNVDLLECLLTYVREDSEVYGGWLSEAILTETRRDLNSEWVVEKPEPLANLNSVALLCSPIGLACCLDDVGCVDQSLISDILRLLSTIQNRKSSSLNKLLHYLLDRQRYHLAGGILYQQKWGGNHSIIDWSDRRIYEHLSAESRDPEVFSTLISDWLSLSPLDTITKLNLSNNALCCLPMCLFTQLPSLEELDLSRNSIAELFTQSQLEEYAKTLGITVLAPNVTRLDLSNNSLFAVPPWIFGTTGTKSNPIFAPRLSILRLCENKLQIVPRQMWLARRLQCLDLSANSIVKLPCVTIEEILSSSSFRLESSDESDLTSDRTISCLPTIPNGVKVMTLLRSDKDLAIPSSSLSVSNLATENRHHWTGGLLHLWLQGNRLVRLPLSENQPNTGRKSSQEMCSVDVGLHLLAPALTSLDVSGNRLFGPLPPPSRFPSNLVHLDLSNNQISSVGLSYDGNKMSSNIATSPDRGRKSSSPQIPDGQFRRLLHLNIRNNRISTFNPISPSASQMHPLIIQLLLFSSGLSDTHLWFPELTSLDLSGNVELRSLSSSVCRLEKLSSLELDGCSALVELPPDLWRLSKLKSLTLFNTPAYDKLVHDIRAEEVVQRQRHKLQQQHRGKSSRGLGSHAPTTLSKSADMPILSTKTILEHLKSLPRSSKPYNNVRLMLIGSRSVGKTSLLKALLHCEDQDRNIVESVSPAGLTITPLRITRKGPSDRPINEWTESVEFGVWDFQTPSGGEDKVEGVLSAVQQFLMSKSAVYVVVWSSADAPDGLHTLAKHLVDIQTRAPNAPVALVTTHDDLPSCMASNVSDVIDRCFLHLPDPSAMGFSQQIFGHFNINPTDLNDHNNLNKIHQLATSIHSAANLLKPPFRKPLIGTKHEPGRQRLLSYSVPLVYHELDDIIRDLAEDLRIAGIPPIVSFEDFMNEVNIRFQATNTSRGSESEEVIRSALTFLHEAGRLLYFANLSQAIVLDPRWLCDLLLRLLISGTGVQSIRGGVLNLSRLKDLLISSDIPSVPVAPEKSEDIDRFMRRFQHLEVSFALTYLVGLLGKFELGAPLDSQHLLVPPLLPMRKLADFNWKISDAANRQIRITPSNNADTPQRQSGMEVFLKDSDPLDCSVYTLPRGIRSKKLIEPQVPPPIAEDSSELSTSSMGSSRKHGIFAKLASNLVPKALRGHKQKTAGISVSPLSITFDRGDKLGQAAFRRGSALVQGQPQMPSWICQAAPSAHEVLRVYALSYVPAGFWTRLITRLLTDSDLNVICGHLYNLSTVAPELRASLLSLENHSSPTGTLRCGWNLSRMGIQLTLAGGALPVFTLEQVGNRVSFATASIEETEIAMEAHESIRLGDFDMREIGLENGESNLVDEKSVLGGLDEADFRAWNLYLMRLSTGCAEDFREHLRGVEIEQAEKSGLIVEAFDDFAKYCLIQLHMPSFSIQWPDYQDPSKSAHNNDFSTCSLHPDRRILTQILTKVVHHIDCLLEDWYPDLGTRFNQSNNGEYLIHRVIPCTDCVKDASFRLRQTEDLRDAVSSLDSVLSGESNDCRKSESDLFKEFKNSSNIVYGILVEELVHWLLTPARNQDSLDQATSVEILPCPMHSHTAHNGISAPDLLFDDVRTEMMISGSRVTLEKFLGRGAFGSVFAGSAFLSSHPTLNVPVTNDSLLSLVKVPVGVKICSPINPMEVDIRLCDWQPFTDKGELEDDSKGVSLDSRTSKTGTSDLSVALALYKQEKRRWSFQPVESCFTAYQELRSELAVLMRVSDDAPVSACNYPNVCFSAPHDSSTLQRSRGSIRLSRRGTLKRCSAKSFNRPKLFSFTVLGSSEQIIGRHLLTYLGVVSPRPLTLLLPLAPKGSLSDWMEEMKSSYEVEGVYPVQQNTLTCIIHQAATALAYLHQVRIVYRDLKPDNILVWQMPPPITFNSNLSKSGTLRDSYSLRLNNPSSEVRVVLSDFGVSRWRASLDGCRGYVGTPGFMAPEVLVSLGEDTYTHKVDIYGLGILMSSIATFQLPYHGFTNLRFQLNQHILSRGRPDIPAKVKSHCSLPYLDLMSLCWSHEPQQRPEASSIVKVTQNALPSPHLLTSPSTVFLDSGNRRCLKQSCLPMTVDTGFDQICNVMRVDAVEVVTCAVIDSEDRIWIGGYSSQTDSDGLDVSGNAFFSRSTSSNRVGRLFVLTEDGKTFRCVLACSWSHSNYEDRNRLPKPASLPINLLGEGYPVAMAVDGGDRLWCVDSVGRLMIFSISTLSLIASTFLLRGSHNQIDGDCILMFPADKYTMILSFSTGWICSVHLTPEFPGSASTILIPWYLNTLRQSRRIKQSSSSCLYLCGARVSENFFWLGGTSDNLTEFQRLPNTETWQQTSTWKASVANYTENGPMPLITKKPSNASHGCGRLCDKSPAVTCITTSWSVDVDKRYPQMVWTSSYPVGEIVCWSVRTRAPLQSIRLGFDGGNLHFQDTTATAFPDIVSSIGSVEQLLFTAKHGFLLVGTSRGALLKIHWPIYDDKTSASIGIDDDNCSDVSSLSSGRLALNRTITARILRLHRGPAERCFNLLSEHRSLGRGFVHPIYKCLEDVARSDVANYECGYFFISLLPKDDNFDLGCDTND